MNLMVSLRFMPHRKTPNIRVSGYGLGRDGVSRY